MADVAVSNEGTVVVIEPLTDAAQAWIEANVYAEAYQWMGRALVVDHRYAPAIVAAMQEDGLVVH